MAPEARIPRGFLALEAPPQGGRKFVAGIMSLHYKNEFVYFKNKNGGGGRLGGRISFRDIHTQWLPDSSRFFTSTKLAKKLLPVVRFPSMKALIISPSSELGRENRTYSHTSSRPP